MSGVVIFLCGLVPTIITAVIAALEHRYLRRESSKAPRVIDGMLVLESSQTRKRLALVASVTTTVEWVLALLLVHDYLFVSTFTGIAALCVTLFGLIAIVGWVWGVFSARIVLSDAGIAITSCGWTRMIPFEDLEDIHETKDDCRLVLKNGKKVSIPVALMGFDLAAARIRARLRQPGREKSL